MAFNSDRTVPFQITDISHGLKEVQGLLKLEETGVELEFEIQDSFIGLFKSGIKNLLIPYSDLEAITYKKGWFSSKIILEGKSMKVFEDIPGTELATCELKVKRKHKKEAESLISRARMQLSEYKLDQLGED